MSLKHALDDATFRKNCMETQSGMLFPFVTRRDGPSPLLDRLEQRGCHCFSIDHRQSTTSNYSIFFQWNFLTSIVTTRFILTRAESLGNRSKTIDCRYREIELHVTFSFVVSIVSFVNGERWIREPERDLPPLGSVSDDFEYGTTDSITLQVLFALNIL